MTESNVEPLMHNFACCDKNCKLKLDVNMSGKFVKSKDWNQIYVP